MGPRSWRGWTGPAGRAPETAKAGVSAALPEVGRRHRALGTRSRGSRRSGRRWPAARAAHLAGAGVRGGAGGQQGSGQRVRLDCCLALRPSIGRNRLCHSLWLTSPSLPRRAAAIGRAAPTSASSAGGFFKGEADPSVRREPPPGLAHTALARTPSRNFTEPHSSGLFWRVHLGGAPRDNRAGACAPLGGCARQWVLLCACMCMHVPVCACGSVGASVRAQVCAHRCTGCATPLPACAPGFGKAGCASHALTAVANQAPAWQGSPVHMRTGVSAESCRRRVSLERLTVDTHPRQVHRGPQLWLPHLTIFALR